MVLQQLEMLQQQVHKPMEQFVVQLHQLLISVDPTMLEHVKLFFLWPWLRNDITRHAQNPKTFNEAILITQRIELTHNPTPNYIAPLHHRTTREPRTRKRPPNGT